MDDKLFFRKNILTWHAGHQRPMPWKGERDPYKIWLSETILQQTRVEQGLPYYLKFVKAYPTVKQLADAPLDEVLKNWEGLGYYSRARNMHAAAKFITQERNGIFPETYPGIRALKGVGDYTAAAIASFAFDLPHAVLDGNVYRVLSRYFGIETPIDSTAGKKQFSALAQSLLDPKAPGSYNQAIMDFGADHCTPRKPGCSNCPLKPRCIALKTDAVAQLPQKSKSLKKRNRFFAYAVFYHGQNVWLHRRNEKDIWRNLYEFPLLELQEMPRDLADLPQILLNHFFDENAPKGINPIAISKTYRQTLTHQVIHAVFCEFKLTGSKKTIDFQQDKLSDFGQFDQFKLKKILAVPRIIDWFWAEKDVTLSLF